MQLDAGSAHDPQSDDDFADRVASAMDNRGENWKARVVLTKIPNAQRRVIELIYLEHLSLARVAERLGLPVEAVKSRCLEGLKRLREGLNVVPEPLS
jgi:RNA polymerase sigma factor (sigma-70 family)